MSIEKITIDASSSAALKGSLKSFLQSTGYFDSVTEGGYNAPYYVYCSLNNSRCMIITINIGNGFLGVEIISSSGAKSYSYSMQNNDAFDMAYKTDNGWCIIQDGTNLSIFASKDNNGNNIIGVIDDTYLSFGSIASSRIIELPLSYVRPSFNQYYSSATITNTLTEKTLFVPLMTYEGDYTQNLFYTPFSQYHENTCGIITNGSIEYIYNGIIALKG